MLKALPYIVAVILVAMAWVAFMIRFDAFTPSDVRAWRRLATLRGYPVARSPFEKLVRNANLVKRLQEELDLNRLLAIAGVVETPLAYLGRVAVISISVTLLTLITEFTYRAFVGDWIFGVGPWVCLFLGAACYVINILDLRQRANSRRAQADRAMGDSLMLVGIMTDGRGLQLEDAVKILSRCVDNDALESIVDDHGFRRLVRTPYGSTIELYRAISDEYGINMFGQVADAAANTNVGMAEREIFTRLAKAVYAHRLADAREKAAKAKILVTVPVAGMLIPLLILLGAPALASIANGLGGQ